MWSVYVWLVWKQSKVKTFFLKWSKKENNVKKLDEKQSWKFVLWIGLKSLQKQKNCWRTKENYENNLYYHAYLVRTNWCQTSHHHIVTPLSKLRPYSAQAPPAYTHKSSRTTSMYYNLKTKKHNQRAHPAVPTWQLAFVAALQKRGIIEQGSNFAFSPYCREVFFFFGDSAFRRTVPSGWSGRREVLSGGVASPPLSCWVVSLGLLFLRVVLFFPLLLAGVALLPSFGWSRCPSLLLRVCCALPLPPLGGAVFPPLHDWEVLLPPLG